MIIAGKSPITGPGFGAGGGGDLLQRNFRMFVDALHLHPGF